MRDRLYKAIAGGLAALTIGGIGTVLAPTAQADVFTVCPSGVSGVATADTSCAFADNVRAAWYSQPGRTVFSYSPVTDMFYTMQCDHAWTTAFWANPKRCYGINAYGVPLVVYIG